MNREEIGQEMKEECKRTGRVERRQKVGDEGKEKRYKERI